MLNLVDTSHLSTFLRSRVTSRVDASAIRALTLHCIPPLQACKPYISLQPRVSRNSARLLPTSDNHGQNYFDLAFAAVGGYNNSRQFARYHSFQPFNHDHRFLEGSLDQRSRNQYWKTICTRSKHIIMVHYRFKGHSHGYINRQWRLQ